MVRTLRRLSTGCALLLVTTPSAAQQTAPSAGWLTGCWALQKGDRIIEETWMPERGGIMLGMSRTVVGRNVREFEFVVLQAIRSGLEYRVQAGDQPEVVFRALKPAASEAVFENPDHDFPKRIGYRLTAPDSLAGWIDGGEGKGEKVRYDYHRVSCSAR
jgi:uncharacterized protein DUF6265